MSLKQQLGGGRHRNWSLNWCFIFSLEIKNKTIETF
jgi:hypothetical protein